MREFENEFDFYLNEGRVDKRFEKIRRRNKLYIESIQSTSSYNDWVSSIRKDK